MVLLTKVRSKKGYSKVLCDWHVSLLSLSFSLDTRDAETEDLGLILEVLTAWPKKRPIETKQNKELTPQV